MDFEWYGVCMKIVNIVCLNKMRVMSGSDNLNISKFKWDGAAKPTIDNIYKIDYR